MLEESATHSCLLVVRISSLSVHGVSLVTKDLLPCCTPHHLQLRQQIRVSLTTGNWCTTEFCCCVLFPVVIFVVMDVGVVMYGTREQVLFVQLSDPRGVHGTEGGTMKGGGGTLLSPVMDELQDYILVLSRHTKKQTNSSLYMLGIRVVV